MWALGSGWTGKDATWRNMSLGGKGRAGGCSWGEECQRQRCKVGLGVVAHACSTSYEGAKEGESSEAGSG
jgi:hypothetical protein